MNKYALITPDTSVRLIKEMTENLPFGTLITSFVCYVEGLDEETKAFDCGGVTYVNSEFGNFALGFYKKEIVKSSLINSLV